MMKGWRSTSARGLLASAAIAAAGLLVAGCGGGGAPSATRTTAAVTGLRGLTPDPLPTKPSFTLTDTAGRPFNLVSGTRGKLTYLYFGYTHCPDVCPATMGELAYVLKHEPASIARRVEVVFVTVDPVRDTPKVLRTWLDHFDPAFVGLTGTVRQIEVAETAAGIPYVPPSHGKAYLTHSAMVLAYSPDDRAHVVYTQGFQPSDYLHDLPLLLRF